MLSALSSQTGYQPSFRPQAAIASAAPVVPEAASRVAELPAPESSEPAAAETGADDDGTYQAPLMAAPVVVTPAFVIANTTNAPDDGLTTPAQTPTPAQPPTPAFEIRNSTSAPATESRTPPAFLLETNNPAGAPALRYEPAARLPEDPAERREAISGNPVRGTESFGDVMINPAAGLQSEATPVTTGQAVSRPLVDPLNVGTAEAAGREAGRQVANLESGEGAVDVVASDDMDAAPGQSGDRQPVAPVMTKSQGETGRLLSEQAIAARADVSQPAMVQTSQPGEPMMLASLPAATQTAAASNFMLAAYREF